MPEKAKPAVQTGGHPEFSVTNWKVYEKNTLRGFLSLTLPSGLTIHNCSLHQKDGSRWIGFPSRQYSKEDGSIGYSPLIEVASDARRSFQDAALAAVDRFMEAAHE